jgi:hypothetical protein
MDWVFPRIRERYWMLAVSNGPGFVCSDSPVTVIARRPPANLLARHASLAMPLSKRLVLVGTLQPPPHALISVDSHYVAQVNQATEHDATELYCPEPMVHGVSTPTWTARSRKKT